MYLSQCGDDLAVQEAPDGGAEGFVVGVVDGALHGGIVVSRNGDHLGRGP